MCIVAVNAGDTRDLITDGVTGRLVDSSQRSGVVKSLEERLAELIVTLSANAEQRERLSESAAAYAREHFWTWDQRMAAEVAAVHELADRARS
jgi:glycosyltransferase involved in cell wall biosynthesis